MASPPPSPRAEGASAAAEKPPAPPAPPAPSTRKRGAEDSEPVPEDADSTPPPHKRPRAAAVGLPWDDDKDILAFEDDSHAVTQSLTYRSVHASDIASNIFSKMGVAGLESFLLRAPRNLTYLDVSNTPIQLGGALTVITCVAQMRQVQLRTLRMENVGMCGSADASSLAFSLRKNAHTLAITELSLKNNVFGEEGVLTVAEALCSLSVLGNVVLSGCAPNASRAVCEAVARRIRALTPGRMFMANSAGAGQGAISVTERGRGFEGWPKATAFSTARRARWPRTHEMVAGGRGAGHPLPTNGEHKPILYLKSKDHWIVVFGGATVKHLTSTLCTVRRYTNEVCSRWEYILANLARLDAKAPGCACEPNDLLRPSEEHADLPLVDVLTRVGGVGSVVTLKSPHRTEFNRRVSIVRVSRKFNLPADIARTLIALTVPYVVRESYKVVTPEAEWYRVCAERQSKAWFYAG